MLRSIKKKTIERLPLLVAVHILLDGKPYEECEEDGFWFLLSSLVDVDDEQLPCRKAVKKDSLRLDATAKSRLKEILKGAKFVTISTDIWTGADQKSYMATNVHVGASVYLLEFARFEGSHTGLRIADAIGLVLEEYAIERKVLSLCSDAASNMLEGGGTWLKP